MGNVYWLVDTLLPDRAMQYRSDIGVATVRRMIHTWHSDCCVEPMHITLGQEPNEPPRRPVNLSEEEVRSRGAKEGAVQ